MGSPKKIIQSVVHQMTTRSGAAASADPVVESPDPAGPPETSVAATADHDIGVLEVQRTTKNITMQNRLIREQGTHANTDASAPLHRNTSELGTQASTDASMYPGNDLNSANVEDSHALLYQRNANSVQISPHLSNRQDDIDNLSQHELEVRIAAIEENRRTNALRSKLRSLMNETSSNCVVENGARCVETEQDRLRRKFVENSKLFTQLRNVSEPRGEIELFESRCSSFHINCDRERLKLLIHIWPRNEIIDFYELNEGTNFDYNKLKLFLIN